MTDTPVEKEQPTVSPAARQAIEQVRRQQEARRRAVDTILPHEAQAFLLDLAKLLELGIETELEPEGVGGRLMLGAARRLRRIVAEARSFESGRRPVSERAKP